MRCAHCCYSCNHHGKHMEYSTFIAAMDFFRMYDNECITIGGGEPTLHPRFFDILRVCLRDFSYVWMATNGSNTEVMWRLSRILDDDDYPEGIDPDDEYEYERACENSIVAQNKLTVALSQDPWHDDIDPEIVRLWKRRAETSRGHYEIRDVSRNLDGVAAQGRAKRTGAGWGEYCVCSTQIIRPDGSIKLCGCQCAPIIGDVWNGIGEQWKKLMDSDKFSNHECSQHVMTEIRKIKRNQMIYRKAA